MGPKTEKDARYPQTGHTSDVKTGALLGTLPSVTLFGSVLGLVGSVSVYSEWAR